MASLEVDCLNTTTKLLVALNFLTLGLCALLFIQQANHAQLNHKHPELTGSVRSLVKNEVSVALDDVIVQREAEISRLAEEKVNKLPDSVDTTIEPPEQVPVAAVSERQMRELESAAEAYKQALGSPSSAARTSSSGSIDEIQNQE